MPIQEAGRTGKAGSSSINDRRTKKQDKRQDMYRDRKDKLGLDRKPDRYVCLAACLALTCPIGSRTNISAWLPVSP
jgi:hypothetical protein